MNKHSNGKKVWVIALVFAVVAAVVPAAAWAKESTETKVETEKTTQTETEKTTQSEPEQETTQEDKSTTVREERQEVKKERLSTTKLKVCQLRESNVNTVMDRIVERSQKHVDRITEAATKAKAFYVAQGNVLANYDELVTTAETKRVAAQAAVDALSTGATFSCESDGPKAEIQTFRNQRLSKIEAVTAYRSAVKELITGIKSVQPSDDQASTEVKQ